jgi:hypothetical protein
MLFRDLKMMTTATGEQYPENNERLSKSSTRQGDSRPSHVFRKLTVFKDLKKKKCENI